MENEIKPVQSSIPLGKDVWVFIPNDGMPQMTITVERGANLLDALWDQKKVGVEFSRSIYLDPLTREVRDNLTGKIDGYLYRGQHID